MRVESVATIGRRRLLASGVAAIAAMALAGPAISQAKVKLQTKDTSLGSISQNIVPGSLVISPDSRRILYRIKKGNQETRVLDGKEGPTFDGVGTLLFSPDGNRTAYVAKQGEKIKVVVDG